MLKPQPSPFTKVNGREVFDNGMVRIWRCTNCKSWRDWERERCQCCGESRDGRTEIPETPYQNK